MSELQSTRAPAIQTGPPPGAVRLDMAHVKRAYATWAPVYDLVFAHLLAPGRRAGVALAQRAGGLVLDVGVGTGLELPLFDPATSVVGIDISEPMLNRAQRRVAGRKLCNVRGLLVMDAACLAFGDASFDAALAPYVISVVPDPVRTLEELARVTRPGGDIILVNHVGAEGGAAAKFEAWLGKRSATLGWRPHFSWSVIAGWLAQRRDIELVERRRLAPFGLFTLIRLRRTA